jgi:RNA polymerase sigma-70 factor (ECF subfamily)
VSPDTELVERLKRRDHDALKELLRQHGSKMYGIAMRYMCEEHEAQEVMQDALITVWNKIGSFEGRSAFTSWLYRVTANAALMALRKQRRRFVEVSTDAPENAEALRPLELSEPGQMPGDGLQQRELGALVHAEIERLPEPYRTTVRLRDVEELPIEEVAELTGVSVAAAKTRLHRARLTLRERLLPLLKDEVSSR